ncbi:peptide deformylase [Pseudomonas sp. HMWF031]|nr:peptide deformylase [Pseudomonas sp. HMWF031]
MEAALLPNAAMTIRAVLRLGHPALRQRARDIEDEVFGTQQLQTLIDDLLETKAARSGAGLAAPQIDEPWRVVVVGMGANPRYPEAPPVPERVLINPEITPLSEATSAGWEGCLSVPGLRGEVERWQRIHLSWRDPNGGWHHEELEGFHARVVQHECDHLDGVLFPDRLRDPTAFGFEAELQSDGRIP